MFRQNNMAIEQTYYGIILYYLRADNIILKQVSS